LATYMSLCLAPAQGLATIAGCGMADALNQGSRTSLEHLDIRMFSNREDGSIEENERFKDALSGFSKDAEIVTREGGHAFSDYEANGSVAEAFRFVVDVLYNKSEECPSS